MRNKIVLEGPSSEKEEISLSERFRAEIRQDLSADPVSPALFW